MSPTLAAEDGANRDKIGSLDAFYETIIYP